MIKLFNKKNFLHRNYLYINRYREIISILIKYGFNEFILALGYKADYIKDFFLNQKAFTSDFTLDVKTHQAEYHLENSDIENGKWL